MIYLTTMQHKIVSTEPQVLGENSPIGYPDCPVSQWCLIIHSLQSLHINICILPIIMHCLQTH